MAGRPVAARGGLTGLHYGLIAFVFVSVLSLVGFVLQLTKVSDLESQAKRAGDQLKSYGQPPAYYAEEANARRSTAFAVLDDDRRLLATITAGVPDAVGKAVEADYKSRLAAVAAAQPGAVNATDTLFTAVQRLSDALTAAKQSAASATDTVRSLEAEKDALTAQKKQIRDEFEAEIGARRERVDQIEKQKAEQIAEKDKQVSDLQAALEASNQEIQQLRQGGVRTQREMELTIARLQKQIETLQEQLRLVRPETFDINALLTKADGRVLRAIPGSDVVYINLGANDKLKVGMGFEVYSQTREAPRSIRGKASLEVVTLLSDSAECRVTRTAPGQPVVEGDIVVNIAFERNRKPKFVVVGDFDLNYDGAVDFEGAEKIKTIIREWGGQITDKLDETTDYVIVGTAPQVPPLTAESSTIVRALATDKDLEKSRFKNLIDEARSMYIPVITQNAFLYLAGYAGDESMLTR